MTDSPVINIHVIGGAGWILLVLPAGWTADMDRLSIDWGTTSVKVSREPAAGKPLLVIRGSVGAAASGCGPPIRGIDGSPSSEETDSVVSDRTAWSWGVRPRYLTRDPPRQPPRLLN